MKGILVLLVLGLLAVGSFAQNVTDAGDAVTVSTDDAGQDCAFNTPAEDRTDCGELGIKEEQCMARGCCWNKLPDGIFGPWCFKFIAAEETTPDAGNTVVTKGGDDPGQTTAPEPLETEQPTVAGVVTSGGQDDIADGTTSPVETTAAAKETQTNATEDEENKSTEAPTKPGKPKDGNVLIVSSRLISNPPFLLEKDSASENDTGRERYEGIIPDLMEAITNEIGTDFDIKIVKDGMFGIEENGDWTGMVGEVYRKEANISGPMRVTVLREQAVDFTYPIIRYEAMLVFRKRHWNQKPKIESLEDLLAQDEVKYGILNGGDIERHIRSSNDPLMINLAKGLKPANNKDSNKAGVKRARDSSDYVFIVEGVLAKLLKLKEPCDLQFVPAGFYHRQYAMAVPNLNPLRDSINNAIVEIKHSGEFRQIFDKWYGEDECARALSLQYSMFVSFVSLLLVKLCH